ncbi:hypothetical protein BH10PSE1_BH10PSE1_31460 [soil metagenome]
MTHWNEKLIDQTAPRKALKVTPLVGYGVAAFGSLAVWAMVGALVLRAL